MPLIPIDAARAMIADPPPSRRFLYREVRADRLPSFRVAGRLLFDPDDVAAYIAARRQDGGSPTPQPVRRATVAGNLAAQADGAARQVAR